MIDQVAGDEREIRRRHEPADTLDRRAEKLSGIDFAIAERWRTRDVQIGDLRDRHERAPCAGAFAGSEAGLPVLIKCDKGRRQGPQTRTAARSAAGILTMIAIPERRPSDVAQAFRACAATADLPGSFAGAVRLPHLQAAQEIDELLAGRGHRAVIVQQPQPFAGRQGDLPLKACADGAFISRPRAASRAARLSAGASTTNPRRFE